VKLLSARRLRPARRILWILLTRRVVIGLTALALAAHLAGYRGWADPLAAWSLTEVSAPTALAYIVLLVVSVAFHETGHLAVAAVRDDMQAWIAVAWSRGIPHFVTYSKRGGGTESSSVSLPLAGVYFQLCFAGALGCLAASGVEVLRAPLLLVDAAIVIALMPMPGTDGARVLTSLFHIRDVDRDVRAALGGTSVRAGIDHCRRNILFAAVVCFVLFILYVGVSSAFLGSILYRWAEEVDRLGAGWTMVPQFLVVGIMLLAPPLYFAIWGWIQLPFLLWVGRRLRPNP
jgi:hypothetical protein